MATIALQVAGSVLGGFLGGPIGAAIGSAVGGTLGAFADQALLGSENRRIEGPRLNDLDGISASEGAPIPRIYGRVRIGGQVIWATEFEEERIIERSGSSGGKSAGGGRTTTTRYVYFANVAIALCEGPVAFVRRIWADGKPLDLAGVTMRFHPGSEVQPADPLIVAKQATGEVPAFRGTAYVVFERLPLGEYGNRLPQFSFELVRPAPGLPEQLRAVNLIPGSTEFGYLPSEVREDFGYGSSQAVNRAQWTHGSDWEASLDALQALAPNLERATLIAAWFGDDLRAGHCTIRPKVEKAGKATGVEWQAAGLTRATADAVSDTAGRPNYGGSPADRAIIEALRDLAARGISPVLHPFVLMDITAGNTLPNPYGGTGQPAFPWRGRITCDPAPGQAGSPEGTAGVNAQVDAFFGTANASHFTLAGDEVIYSGPAEWSYSRFVLHMAMLARAGGAEGFLIGSELVGLTHLSSGAGAFPFVQKLVALAGEARTILGPGVKLSYAADWTEYAARVRNSGQDVRFPLDPLWASANIDAVAIDFYPPVTDWRAGRSHADAAIAYSGADAAYIAARLVAGEAFDWFYADDAGRIAQMRLPITDGAYGKPWVFRAKDIRSWWANPHVERVGGVELGAPTGWVPQGKPIWLAEIGAPAVDKGANQPNVFPDPKSSEDALPYFSSGARDDLVQRRLIEAYFSAFDPALPGFDAARNPISTLYGGRMVDPAFIAPWAWDARPYPAFPAQTELWADGANWARGHWLNGRIEGYPVDRLVAAIAADFGHAVPAFREVDGFVDGYVIDRPMSARAAIEPVLAMFGLTVRLEGEGIAVLGPPVRTAATLSRDDLVADKDKPEIEITRAQESELPREVSFGFVDPDRDFRKTVAAARKQDGAAEREMSEDSALALPAGLAAQLAEARLHDLWTARETFRFTLRPNEKRIEPGDLVALPVGAGTRLVQVSKIVDGRARACEGRAVDPAQAVRLPAAVIAPPAPRLPALPGAPFMRLIELPIDRGAEAGPVAAAIHAQPWSGPYSLAEVRAEGLFEPLASALTPTRIGETLTPLGPGPLWRWDHAAKLELRLQSGALASLSDEAALAGGNALALIDAAGEIEIVLFRTADLIGASTYRLTGLVRGMAGSETAAARTLPSGSLAILLDGAIVDLGLSFDTIGRTIEVMTLPAGRPAGDASMIRRSITPTGRALRPLAPVHARARREAGGVRISFIRRARRDGDSLDLFEVPLGETREEYRIEIMNGSAVARTITLATPDYLYPVANELADFSSAQASLAVRIAQVSAEVGAGDVLAATLPVG